MSWVAKMPKDFHVPGRLSQHVVVVTGAASGIGRACAVRYAREGARVVIVDVDKAGGEETLAQVQAVGGQAIYQYCDVTDATQVQTALNAGGCIRLCERLAQQRFLERF